jgi:hypothetical protein
MAADTNGVTMMSSSTSISTGSSTGISAGRIERQPTHRELLRPFWFFGALMMMLDGLTTYIALTFHADDGAREGNPIAVWAIEHIGVAGTCTLKVLIGVAMMWRLAAAADRGHRLTWLNRGLLLKQRPLWKVRRNAAWVLAFSLVLMGVVVGNNLRTIINLSMQ